MLPDGIHRNPMAPSYVLIDLRYGQSLLRVSGTHHEYKQTKNLILGLDISLVFWKVLFPTQKPLSVALLPYSWLGRSLLYVAKQTPSVLYQELRQWYFLDNIILTSSKSKERICLQTARILASKARHSQYSRLTTQAHINTLTPTHSYAHPHTHSLIGTHILSYTHRHTHAHTNTHTLTHKHKYPYYSFK